MYMIHQHKWWLLLSLTFGFLFILFCTDPQKPDFDTPEPFSITLFSDSLGTDTLKSGDAFFIGDPLYLNIKTNRLKDIVSIAIIFQNISGDTLFDSVTTTFDTTQLVIPVGFYIPQNPGNYSLYFNAVTIDTTIHISFNLIIFGLSPELENNKQIQRSGIPVVDLPFYLYVSAAGSDTLKFSWYKNDTLISRASSDNLKFDTLASVDSGIYRCMVKNDYGADTSINDTLQLYYLPEIVEMGTSGIPEKDSSFFIYVKATGSDTLKYQWYKNDTAVTGAINDTIKFDTLHDSNNGTTYHCVVSNIVGSDKSNLYTIILGNHPPQWIHDTLYGAVNEGVTFTMSLPDSCTDPDNDSLTFSILAGPPAGDTITVNNIYTYLPTYNDAGQYTVTISASDDSLSSNAILILTINDVNRKPIFVIDTPSVSYQIDEGDTLRISFKAVDPDGDPVTCLLAQNTLPRPQTTVFDTSQRIITWASMVNDSGAYIIELHALDGTDTGKVTIDIGVGDVNLPPQITINGYQSGESITAKEQTAFSCTVSVTDPNSGDNPVLLPAKNSPPNSTYDTVTGIFLYTPDFTVSNKQSNTTFSNVTFFATDNISKAIDSFIVHITVEDSNAAPQCTNIVQTAQEGVAEGIDIPATDVDGDPLTWTITQGPLKGIVSSNSGNITTGNEFNYTANNLLANDNDLIGITISDGIAQCNIEANITIQADNDAPIITSTAPTTATEHQPYIYNPTADDPEGGTLTWSLIKGPSGMSINSSSGSISWTPGERVAPSVNVTIRATDDGVPQQYGEQNYTITVTSVNDDPYFTDPKPGNVTVGLGTIYEVSLTADDPEGDDVTITLNNPPQGMSYNSITGKVTWNVDRMSVIPGAYNITANVDDVNGGTDTHSWDITVEGHTWQLMNSNMNIVIYNFAGKDANTAYYFLELGDGYWETTNGGTSWTQKYNHTSAYENLYIHSPITHEDNIYFWAEQWGGTIRYVNNRKINDNTILFEREFDAIITGFDVSPDNKLYFTYWDIFDDRTYIGDPDDADSAYYIGDGDLITDIGTVGSGTYKAFAVGNDVIWRKSTNWIDLGVTPDINIKQIEIASDNGDRIYLVSADSTLYYGTGFGTLTLNFTSINLSNMKIIDICMISTNVGWILDKNGNVYFTNDNFAHYVPENLENGGTGVVIENIFVAEDGVSIFAYGNGCFFRY